MLEPSVQETKEEAPYLSWKSWCFLISPPPSTLALNSFPFCPLKLSLLQKLKIMSMLSSDPPLLVSEMQAKRKPVTVGPAPEVRVYKSWLTRDFQMKKCHLILPFSLESQDLCLDVRPCQQAWKVPTDSRWCQPQSTPERGFMCRKVKEHTPNHQLVAWKWQMLVATLQFLKITCYMNHRPTLVFPEVVPTCRQGPERWGLWKALVLPTEFQVGCDPAP